MNHVSDRNPMMKISPHSALLAISVALASVGCAPSVKTLELNPDVSFPMRGRGSENELEHFYPLPKDTTGLGAIFVATVSNSFDLSASGSSDLGFDLFRSRAGYYQANHYRIESPKCTVSNNPCEILLRLFRTKDTFIPSPDTSLTNTYIVFGPKIALYSPPVNFTLDSLTIELNPIKYWMFRNTQLRPMVLNSGGDLIGTTITLSTTTQPVQYLRVAGSRVRPGITPMGGIGVSFSRGSFGPVSEELAIYLLNLLERQEDPSN